MATKQFQTNLNCGSCVAAITPYLKGDTSIKTWSVDTSDPRKVLTIEGDNVSRSSVENLVSQAGFKVMGEITPGPASNLVQVSLNLDPTTEPKKSILVTYYPLLLVVGYLVGLVAAVEIASGTFHWMRAMANFMGGFFVAFSFFKLLDLPGFVSSYQTYDVLARRSRAYGYAYPFVELSLGLAYVIGFQPIATNLATLVIMVLGLIGVTQALLAKRKIQCACLGTVFQLPMSYVTFIEDGLMAIMAVGMLGSLLLN